MKSGYSKRFGKEYQMEETLQHLELLGATNWANSDSTYYLVQKFNTTLQLLSSIALECHLEIKYC